jgi:hypothetical protein
MTSLHYWQLPGLIRISLAAFVNWAPASAHSQESEPPSRACFDIVRSTRDCAAGTILLNHCTGQTWMLVRNQTRRNNQVAYRWMPIAVSNSELIGPPAHKSRVQTPLKADGSKCFTFQSKRYCE